MVRNSVETRNKKKITIKKCFELFDKYNQIILVGFNNVGSNQVQQIRKQLVKSGGQLLIAKNVQAAVFRHCSSTSSSSSPKS
ncbi:MAG: 50S ribosomal protein L10 [Pseudorhodoferax sp.]